MRARTIISTIGILAGVLAIAAGLGAWKYRTMQKGAAGGAPYEPMESVQVGAAEAGTYQRSLNAVGTVWAMRHIEVSTELAGKVTEVGYESGQIVEQGSILIRLDSSTEQADLRSAEAAVDLARVTLDRYQQALSGKAVSEREIDKAKAELVQAQARVEQLSAMIAKKTIFAPFKGRVGMRDTHPGQYLSEGQRLTTLQGLSDEVNVDFSVPQIQAAGLRIGSPVTVVVGAGTPMATDLPAKVTAFDSQIELATRNAKVRATLPSMGGRLAPGMFVDVRVPIGEPVAVVTVPPTAVRHAPFGDHLFVIEPDPKDPAKLRAHQRFVKLGGAAGSRVIIADGLKVGEQLAADGSFKLHEGALVMAAPPPAPSPAADKATAERPPATPD